MSIRDSDDCEKPMRTIQALLIVCFAAAIPAQEREVLRAKEKLKQRVEAMREAMREGKILSYNVRVKVRLQNGNRMKGVVKNGRFVELHDGLDFVSAGRQDDGSGLRLWYTAGTKSFIFLSYRDIVSYEIGAKLSDEQVKVIEAKISDQRQETQKNYRRISKQIDRGNSGTGKEQQAEKTEKTETKLTEAQSELLMEFPPSEGWSAEKREQLQIRRITLGVYPNDEEKKFEEVFDAWSKAYAIQKASEKAEESPLPVPGIKKTTQPPVIKNTTQPPVIKKTTQPPVIKNTAPPIIKKIQ